jgi:hypothetical protein
MTTFEFDKIPPQEEVDLESFVRENAINGDRLVFVRFSRNLGNVKFHKEGQRAVAIMRDHPEGRRELKNTSIPLYDFAMGMSEGILKRTHDSIFNDAL